jgi:hypothetical protein
MTTQNNDITILVNNKTIAYTADTLNSKDGLGVFSIRNSIVGGGQTEQVFSQDLATKVGMVKFSLPTTTENEALVRSWKINKNNNVVELIGAGGEDFTKIFTQAAILGDPEFNYATDGDVEVEFNSNPAQ